MSSFYRYIYLKSGKYWVVKNNEWFILCNSLAEALYERDRLMAVDWDWDKYCELPETPNNYIHIDLPLFEHKPKYIIHDKEYWRVVGKGRKGKYYGVYYTKSEADEVALIYGANVYYCPRKYRVQRRIDGKTKTFGYYDTLAQAEQRVDELIENGWEK